MAQQMRWDTQLRSHVKNKISLHYVQGLPLPTKDQHDHDHDLDHSNPPTSAIVKTQPNLKPVKVVLLPSTEKTSPPDNHRSYSQHQPANNPYHHHSPNQTQQHHRPRRLSSSSTANSRRPSISSNHVPIFNYHIAPSVCPDSPASSITIINNYCQYPCDNDEMDPPRSRSSSSHCSDLPHHQHQGVPPPTHRGRSNSGNHRQRRPPPRDHRYPPISAENNAKGRRKLQKVQSTRSRSGSESSYTTLDEPRRLRHRDRGWS